MPGRGVSRSPPRDHRHDGVLFELDSFVGSQIGIMIAGGTQEMNFDRPVIRVSVGSRPRESVQPQAQLPSFSTTRETFTPPIDIHEGPEGLVLEADIPGANEQSLQIQLEDNVLNLYARIEPSTLQQARLIHEEYRLGDYHRSFILSDEVDRERITAEFKNGVLRLVLPKADRARTRRIEIKSPDAGTTQATT
jgi:HSP20 family molecular chaperone IbpA